MTASGSRKKEMGSQYSVGAQSFSFGRWRDLEMDGDKYKSSLKLFQLFIYYVCAMVHMYRPENNLWELVRSFYQHKGAYITELHELCILW